MLTTSQDRSQDPRRLRSISIFFFLNAAILVPLLRRYHRALQAQLVGLFLYLPSDHHLRCCIDFFYPYTNTFCSWLFNFHLFRINMHMFHTTTLLRYHKNDVFLFCRNISLCIHHLRRQ